MESLRQLDAFPPGSPTASTCGSDAAGGCGGSAVSVSPSDSASCCCRGAGEGGAGEPATAGAQTGADAQAAVELTLARQLRQLQLYRKAALAGPDGGPRGGGAPGQLRPAAAPASPLDAAIALLHCSPSSAASCSGPGGAAAASAIASGAIRPTLLQFTAAAMTDAPAAGRAAGPDNGKKPPPAPGRRGVFVGNLPSAATERALMALFSRAGPIDSLWIARDPRNRLSLGYG
jgi:hypothetical protein